MSRVKVPGGEIQPLGEFAEAVLTRSQPSVTIKLDGKGVYSYEVKAYADTMKEALEEAIMACRTLDDHKFGKMPE
jgi:hypothetical protein